VQSHLSSSTMGPPKDTPRECLLPCWQAKNQRDRWDTGALHNTAARPHVSITHACTPLAGVARLGSQQPLHTAVLRLPPPINPCEVPIALTEQPSYHRTRLEQQCCHGGQPVQLMAHPNTATVDPPLRPLTHRPHSSNLAHIWETTLTIHHSRSLTACTAPAADHRIMATSTHARQL
jgi:hypothetical protein